MYRVFRLINALIVGVAVFLCPAASVGAVGPPARLGFELLVKPGPWSGVSRLIGYDNRVWFTNSVKFVNHNSGDIYSYDPETHRTRYEAHLFSQDAGDPVVFQGLLYWPFEDPRFSAGRAEYMVTNGQDWSWREIESGPAFHLHAMAGVGKRLYAATSAWRAGIHRSPDGGLSWRQLYHHPTPNESVSRITSLAAGRDRLYAGLSQRFGPGDRLLEIANGAMAPVRGAPKGLRGAVLTFHQGKLYSLVRSESRRILWRSDDKSGEIVEELSGELINEMSSDGARLWAVTAVGKGGRLWRSNDGQRWKVVHRFDDEIPLDVLAYRGNIYVGTFSAGGKGALWGTRRTVDAAMPAESAARPIPAPTATPPASLDGELEQALSSGGQFARYRERLIEVLAAIADSRSPEAGQMLADELDQTNATGQVSVFGGIYKVTRARAARWYLLRAIGLTRHGSIPPALLNMAWDEKNNSAAKYFHPAPAAAWAVSRTKQNDRDTLQALMDGLDQGPDWLTGDYVGALSSVTGERFGYDTGAWRRWWADYATMLPVPAGRLSMGSREGNESERPVHDVYLDRFYLDRHEVNNEAFAAFVQAKSYVTDAEKADWAWHWTGRWQRIEDADWRHPYGPGSDIGDLPRHPVVQVSWNDARAYCEWQGKRLPSEAEWERAARGAGRQRYAWGDTPPNEGGRHRAAYGADDCCRADAKDGYLYTAPTGSFPAGRSPFGHHDLTGNVWEWVEDWYSQGFYSRSPQNNPVNSSNTGSKVIRGGGWGNNPWGLRTTLRHSNPPHYPLSMVGFRCARDAPG